jgi:oligosaccharide reducing-end xylanase
MNRITGKTVTLLLSAALGSIIFADVEAPYEVGPWANFAKGAITHGFDDNMNTNPTAQEQTIFDTYKFHISLHVQTASVNWANAKASFAKGHEISSHTVNHSSSNDGFQKSQAAIKSNVPGEKCVTVAYPDCQQNGANTLSYFIAGRNCNGQVNDKTPGDFSQIGAVGVGSGQGGYTNTTSGINAIADQAISKGGWAVCMHHGIGSQSHNWATTNLDAMKGHLKYLDENRNKIWMETFGNVARYIKERNAATLKVKSSTDSKFTITLTDNLADSIYNYPLTIRRPLPDGWTDVAVYQNSKLIADSIVTIESKKYIMFNAVPDSGDIVITPPVGINKDLSHSISGNNITFHNSLLSFNAGSFSGSSITASFFDLRGKLIFSNTCKNNASEISVPVNLLNHSAFVAKITDGKSTVVSRCLSQM